jgi:glycosyltransferase involved in cell wall biosynthesis
MMKKLVLMCAPFTSRSGYGDHARSIFYALHQTEKYEIKLLDVRWGDTPRNFLQKDNLAHKSVLDAILDNQQLNTQPDIYIDIRIPNEFETFGKYNIGITAGIETNAISTKWVEGCNKMDLVIVPSNHSKEGIVNVVYDKMQNLPDGKQQKVGELKVEKSVEVIFEGADETIFKPLKVNEINKSILNKINTIVEEDFAFLFVGQWVKGGYGEDRKDIGKLIKVFIETFANLKKQPALILKTSGATFSIIDRKETLRKIKDVQKKFPQDWSLPNIYLLHGDLTDEEMNDLYNHPKIKCMTSFTHGEGFGRPLLEASMVGLPIIASAWSGHIDFLDSNYALLLKGSLEQVPGSAVWEDIIIPESKWFVIDEHSAYSALKFAFENKNEIKEKAKRMMRDNRKKYTLNNMTELLNEVVDKYVKHLDGPTQLNLPKLKKVGENKSPKIKLPKLKKVT